MSMVRLPQELVARLHREADATRWQVSVERFAEALEAGCLKADPASSRSEGEVEAFLRSLHLRDLALACACAGGHEPAWDHFVLEYRPLLYRGAEALRPGDGRELADSLYAELFGLSPRGEARSSLFRYFHGRSSLATWLRAILAQRHVDMVRVDRRHEPLPDDDASPGAERLSSSSVPSSSSSPERDRWVNALRDALSLAIAAIDAKDRLRLALYYAESLTLAEIGRALGEHEATVSRHLSRTRRALRSDVERRLRDKDRMTKAEIEECLASVSADAGTLDLSALINAPPPGEVDRAGKGGVRSRAAEVGKIDAV